MEIDVAARARAGVRLKRPHQPVEQPVRPRRAARLAQADAIDHEQLEQRHRIGAFPLAFHPGAEPADRAAHRQPDERAPAVERDRRVRPRLPPAERPFAPVRQAEPDGALLPPGCDISEERRVGKESVSKCKYRWQQMHSPTKIKYYTKCSRSYKYY